MLNPIVSEVQGYDCRLVAPYPGQYDPALNVAARLPLTLAPGNSLVSAISKDSKNEDRPFLRTAAVLTVLASPAPPGAFRPPFAGGADKSVRFNKSQLDYSKLARRAATEGAPSLARVERYFQRPWLDHAGFGWHAQYFNPTENMRSYGHEIAAEVELGALLLQTNLADRDKERLLVGMTQVGIDIHGLSLGPDSRKRWDGAGGHNGGRKLPVILAGMVLGDVRMTAPSAVFSEDDQTYHGRGWTGDTALFRMYPGLEHEEKHPSAWTVDGRGRPGDPPAGWDSDSRSETYRLCCTAHSWVGEALAMRMMGGVATWKHQPFFDYVDRWMLQNWEPFCSIVTAETGLSCSGWQGRTSHPFVASMWRTYR